MSATATQASGLDGFGRAQQTFAAAGLAEPPIPNRFRSRIRVEAPWCFATRTVNAMDMYFFQRYPAEVLTGSPRDYIAISHAGHGANSYAINYHLVDGVIAVFAQIGWGVRTATHQNPPGEWTLCFGVWPKRWQQWKPRDRDG